MQGPAFAAGFTSHIASVLDGDTIEVLHNNHAKRIQLNGIDCPEKGQAYRKRAKQAVSELVYGKEVTVQTYVRDKYGQTIAEVLLPDNATFFEIHKIVYFGGIALHLTTMLALIGIA